MIVDYVVFGQRIAQRRKALDMVQDELAAKAGITASHVRNIEKAHTKCSIDTMCKLCSALGVSPDYLFLGALKSKEDAQLVSVIASLQLCDERQLRLIASLISCVVEENQE